MKKIFILCIFIFITLECFGQACGVYRLNYKGNINSDLDIVKIKLPNILYLHGLDIKNSFVETEIPSGEINSLLNSPLISELFDNAETLFDFYKSKREALPVLITVIDNKERKEILFEIHWDSIQLTKLNDDNFGNLFELNFKEINLNGRSSNESYPWDDSITEIAIDAINLSIQNNMNNVIDKNFPNSPGTNKVPFELEKTTLFKIIGYSISETNPNIYKIVFQEIDFQGFGNGIVVEIYIETKKAVQVFMKADG
jgi:hypothetical protein